MYFLLDAALSALSARAEAPPQPPLPPAASAAAEAAAGHVHETASSNDSGSDSKHAQKADAAAAAAAAVPAAPAAPQGPAQLDALLNDPSCRACTSTRDLFAAFGAQLRGSHSLGAGRAAAGSGSSDGNERQAGSGTATTTSGGGGGGDADADADDERPPFWFYEDEMPPPPDVVDIGRATWTLLHVAAAYYPDAPSQADRDAMAGLIQGLAAHYPCHVCRAHLRRDVAEHPPDLSGADALSDWACRLHNRVNERLGKPMFDCALALQRWRDGPPQDGAAAGARVEYGLTAHNRAADAEEVAASGGGGGADGADGGGGGAGVTAAAPAAATRLDSQSEGPSGADGQEKGKDA